MSPPEISTPNGMNHEDSGAVSNVRMVVTVLPVLPLLDLSRPSRPGRVPSRLPAIDVRCST